eukprot:6474115-Amphidinium_carterae.2
MWKFALQTCEEVTKRVQSAVTGVQMPDVCMEKVIQQRRSARKLGHDVIVEGSQPGDKGCPTGCV